MRISHIGTALMLGALVLFGAGSARASVCSSLGQYTPDSITCESSFTGQLLGNTVTLTLPLADPSANSAGYGELESVTVQFSPEGVINDTLTTSITSTGYVQNTNSTASDTQFKVEGTMGVDSADNPDNVYDQDLSGFNLAFETATDVVNTTLGKYNATGGTYPAGYVYTLTNAEADAAAGPITHTGTGYAGYTTSDTAHWYDVTASLGSPESFSVTCPSTACGDFIYSGSGPTTFSTNFTSSGSYDGVTPSNGNEGQQTLMSGVVDITYTFGPTGGCPGPGCSNTPEPATCGLFAPALVGLLLFRKRFKRS